MKDQLHDTTDPEDAARPHPIELTLSELRGITGWAAGAARSVLMIVERDLPGDQRPRAAVEAARAFADGGARTAALRRVAAEVWQLAGEAATPAGREATRAASQCAAVAYLHPSASTHQVRHVLGAVARAARAEELLAGEDPAAARRVLDREVLRAPPAVAAVLRRLPLAPPGGAEVGRLVRELEADLR